MNRLYQQVLYLLLSFALIFPLNDALAQSVGSTASSNTLQMALNALQQAEAVHAPTLAGSSYQIAQDAFNQAQLYDAKRKKKDAQRMAEKSIRYAELASTEARYYQLKIEVENKVTENADLRRTLLLGTPDSTQ